MTKSFESEIRLQRQYYAATAGRYDQLHGGADSSHFVALGFLTGLLDDLQVKTILDIGSGTGRCLLYLKEKRPDLKIIGIEPVRELREIGYSKGLAAQDLVDGDATRLAFQDGAFDLVCEFGALHHIPRPERAVKEMLRVAKKAIFISDSNNFGEGSALTRLVKQGLNGLGLWPLANWIKTRGRGYSLGEGDGLAYSYSVFNNYTLIKRHCRRVYLLDTDGRGVNPYRSASHVALLGIKR
ncbi:MAG: methyltransferase domain-containing protein [bacterium]